MTTTSRDWKSQALSLSLFLNFLLLGLIFYLFLQNPIPVPLNYHSTTTQSTSSPSNVGEIVRLARVSQEELILQLKDKKLLEDGYRKRDLALAVLVQRDHIDIERALARPLSKRTMKLNEKISLSCFPGLDEKDFERAILFLENEAWPETTEGLFLLLKKEGLNDLSLVQSFIRTNEFHLVERLFQSANPPVKKGMLLKMLLEGNFRTLQSFVDKQKVVLDCSENRRRQFLLEYVKSNSKSAAALLLRTDFHFALKEIEDENVLRLLALLPHSTKLTSSYAKELVHSPRGEAVSQAAAAFLQIKELNPRHPDEKDGISKDAAKPASHP